MVFVGSMDRKNSFNISAEWFQFIFSMFSCLILKLKSLSGTSFGLYFSLDESTLPILLRCSRGTVLSAEESFGTVLSVDF